MRLFLEIADYYNKKCDLNHWISYREASNPFLKSEQICKAKCKALITDYTINKDVVNGMFIMKTLYAITSSVLLFTGTAVAQPVP